MDNGDNNTSIVSDNGVSFVANVDNNNKSVSTDAVIDSDSNTNNIIFIDNNVRFIA